MLRLIHLLTIIYVIVLTLLLEMPIDPPEIVEEIAGPLVRHAHLITFTLLGFLVELGRTRKSMLFWLSLLLGYAVSAELLQLLLNSLCHRTFDWWDMLNNVVGALFGTLIGYCCRPLVKRPVESLDKMG